MNSRNTDWRDNSVYVLESIDELKDEVHAVRDQMVDDRTELLTKFDDFREELRAQHSQTREEFAILKGQSTVIAAVCAVIISSVANYFTK